jgi:1-deoxy-D-xylulose-5-phosphate synthase
MPEWRTPFEQIQVGKGRKLKDGRDVAILTFGHPGNFAVAAIRELRTEGIDPAHYDMRFAKPLDEGLLHEIFTKFSRIITVEDGAVHGGFGSAVLEFMTANNYNARVKILGIPDKIVEHGSLKDLHGECGFDTKGIANATRDMVKDLVHVNNLLG